MQLDFEDMLKSLRMTLKGNIKESVNSFDRAISIYELYVVKVNGT